MTTTTTLKIDGSITSSPVAQTSGLASVLAQLAETETLSNISVKTYTLAVNTAVVVDLDQIDEINMLFVKVISASPVTLTLTDSTGAPQEIVVDDMLLLKCRGTAPIALSLTRTLGVEATVALIIGQYS